MRIRSLLALATACAAVTACAGLKDAFTAHSNVVATAASQQLTVERLGGLIGHTQLQIQPTKENIDIVAGLWVDYQLLAEAAAKGDSLNNPKEIAASTQTFAANQILRHFEAVVDSGLIKDGPTEAGYDAGAGDLFDARHILFQFPAGATAAEKDSVHKKALSVLPQVNSKNFAAMAKKYSADGSAAQGGDLGVFAKSAMVPEFANAVAGLKPGQISGLVETQFGFHIIQRLTYAEAKADYDKQYPQMAGMKAERAYFAKIDSQAGIQIKPGAAQAVRVAALDPANHRKDNTQLASFNGGNLTISRFLMWMDGFPAQQNIPQQLQSAPD
ncbi:MAG TPA: peptidylprolyl isomerase, partial [Gemmatimonadaceae bacterium]